MSLRLSGDGVGYGCSEHGTYVFFTGCEECVARRHLCQIYGITPEELRVAIMQTENDRMLERMQTSEWREAADRAFNATPKELGEAALRQAQISLDKGTKL